MEPSKSKPKIRGINDVGRYAVGVQWMDGHDSIFTLDILRRFCPCNVCGGRIDGEIPAASQRLAQFSRIGDAAVFVEWADGHETFYTTSQLRDLCRCARCIGEPERPLTG